MARRRENRGCPKRAADPVVIRVRQGGHMQRPTLSACSPPHHCWPSSNVLPHARSPPPDQRRHDHGWLHRSRFAASFPPAEQRAPATAQGTNSPWLEGASKSSPAWVPCAACGAAAATGADDLGCPEGKRNGIGLRRSLSSTLSVH